ncbi:MAG: hypothetical protein EXR28_06990, partial [Betaproteobacteria bacterium]|nr:hypothetical protein [Betaproteobacteria bacterium]
ERIEPLTISGLDALMAATISEIVIDQDGLPLEIRVPDPRLYAAHKQWLSDLPDRSPGKRDRDRSQSKAVVDLVRTRKPVLSPLPLLPDNPDAARLGTLLNDLHLAE